MASSDSDINILLLGETGVGKSTFINAFVNYIQYNSLDTALKSKLVHLIPSRFTITDENFFHHEVQIGSDKNEDIEIGNSSTQGARGYVFPYDNRRIRIIDSPGIGDARGIDQDKINFENVLNYIGQFQYLHAICFLLKPNVCVMNAYFTFCLQHLLSRLEKSAADNIIFVFTNSRSTNYRPTESLTVLRRILNDINQISPDVEIPCSKRNMFCVDNEAFRYLAARNNGVQFGTREKENFSLSWEKSYTSCMDLLYYICGNMDQEPLKPHEIRNTLSVNEARRYIIDLSRPLADITDLIQDNLIVLARHEHDILQQTGTISELKKKLYIPTMTLKEVKLQQPVTVCAAVKCSEVYVVEGIRKHHYKQRCHNPCYLTNVPTEIIGSPELINCAAMRGTNCKKCSCDFSCHMHISYETEIVSVRLEDESIKLRINTHADMVNTKTELVRKLQSRSQEYKREKAEISKTMAKFAHFFQTSSISPYNDAYLDYLNYLIERENGLGASRNMDTLNHYRDLKHQYQEEKAILDEAFAECRKYNRNAVIISTSDVFDCVHKLYRLKHTGKKIKDLHMQQSLMRQNEVENNTEYLHPQSINRNKEKMKQDTTEIDKVALIVSLLEEDDLETIRKRIKELHLNNSLSEAEICDEKQQLWNFVSEQFKLKEHNKKVKSGESKGAFRKQTTHQEFVKQNRTKLVHSPVPNLFSSNNFQTSFPNFPNNEQTLFNFRTSNLNTTSRYQLAPNLSSTTDQLPFNYRTSNLNTSGYLNNPNFHQNIPNNLFQHQNQSNYQNRSYQQQSRPHYGDVNAKSQHNSTNFKKYNLPNKRNFNNPKARNSNRKFNNINRQSDNNTTDNNSSDSEDLVGPNIRAKNNEDKTSNNFSQLVDCILNLTETSDGKQKKKSVFMVYGNQ